MLIDHYEPRIKQVGLPLDKHRVLLALPLIFVLNRDTAISESERQSIEQFARERLLFGAEEMRLLRSWLKSPPRVDETSRGLSVLLALHAARDVATIDNRTVELVFFECERRLRDRERPDAGPTDRGREALSRLSRRFGIDLGTPWQDVAPEEFEGAPSRPQPGTRSARKSPRSQSNHVRRWQTALRESSGYHESGGLV